MSQKADKMNEFHDKKKDYAIESPWDVLDMVTERLLEEGATVPSSAEEREAVILSASMRLLDKCYKEFGHSKGTGLEGDKWPLFVRSCPLKPRPGVLPSVRVDDTQELSSTIKDIMRLMMSEDTGAKKFYPSGLVDPHGSLMVMPFMDADASAVVSPRHYIMMGESNDGITAGGNGLKVAIPIDRDPTAEEDLNRVWVDPDLIELEFVSELRKSSTRKDVRDHSRSSNGYRHRSAIVQLRGCAGPRPIGTPPKGVTISGTFHGAERITVDNIYICKDESEEELARLEEALLTTLPTTPNTVVVHYGGNHLSHHAGQCMDAGVPYIALKDGDKPVQVGDKWTQAALGWVVLDMDESFEPQPYDPMDFKDDFIHGFVKAYGNFGRQHGWLSNHFHQFIGGPINELNQTAQLAGGFVAWLINASLSVGVGEVRHITSSAHDFTLLPMATLMSIYTEDDWVELKLKDGPNDRKHYYTMIENKPLTLDGTVSLFKFLEDIYQGNWSGGYGGLKYGESCKNARLLTTAMSDFIKSPTDENFKSVLSNANATEHNVHNNGFFFNKFIQEAALHWGTNPSTVRINPNHFFSVFYAAQDVLNATVNDNFHSIEELMQVAESTTVKQLPTLHENALFSDALNFMKNSEYLRGYLHPRGKHSTTSKWVSCGMNCKECVYIVAKQKQEKEAHLIALKESLSTSTVPVSSSIDAPFPTPQPVGVKPTLATTKSLSKQTSFSDVDVVWLAHAVGEHGMVWDHAANKYLALIISQFTTEQLLLFAKTQGELTQ